jgi:hypothetical protein
MHPYLAAIFNMSAMWKIRDQCYDRMHGTGVRHGPSLRLSLGPGSPRPRANEENAAFLAERCLSCSGRMRIVSPLPIKQSPSEAHAPISIPRQTSFL